MLIRIELLVKLLSQTKMVLHLSSHLSVVQGKPSLSGGLKQAIRLNQEK